MWSDVPCREWTGYTIQGYGRIFRRVNGRKVSLAVHRLAWEKEHGPIPDGLFVLHRCDNRACYEVEHLFLGTHKDNMRDMHAKGRGRGPLNRTHCPKGHPYDEANTYVNAAGAKCCRACTRERMRRHRSKLKENC